MVEFSSQVEEEKCMSGREAGLGERDEEFCFRCPEFRWFRASQLGCECLDLGTVKAIEDKSRAEAIPWNAATAPHCEKPTMGNLPARKGETTAQTRALQLCTREARINADPIQTEGSRI